MSWEVVDSRGVNGGVASSVGAIVVGRLEDSQICYCLDPLRRVN